MALEKRDHERPPLVVRPTGVLAGHEFAMRRLSARDYIESRRGDLDDGAMVERMLDAIVDSTLPDDAELAFDEALELLAAWVRAHREAAVPPVSGETPS